MKASTERRKIETTAQARKTLNDDLMKADNISKLLNNLAARCLFQTTNVANLKQDECQVQKMHDHFTIDFAKERHCKNLFDVLYTRKINAERKMNTIYIDAKDSLKFIGFLCRELKKPSALLRELGFELGDQNPLITTSRDMVDFAMLKPELDSSDCQFRFNPILPIQENMAKRLGYLLNNQTVPLQPHQRPKFIYTDQGLIIALHSSKQEKLFTYGLARALGNIDIHSLQTEIARYHTAEPISVLKEKGYRSFVCIPKDRIPALVQLMYPEVDNTTHLVKSIRENKVNPKRIKTKAKASLPSREAPSRIESLDITPYFARNLFDESDKDLQFALDLKAKSADVLPKQVIYVVDCSSSMLSSFSTLQNVLKEQILDKRLLNTDDQVAIIAFGNNARVLLKPTVISKLDESSFETKVLNKIRDMGCTDISSVLPALASMLTPENTSASNLIFLTDGCANQGITETAELIEAIKKTLIDCSGDETKLPQVLCLSFTSETDKEMLQALAGLTNCPFSHVDNDNDLEKGFESLLELVNSRTGGVDIEVKIENKEGSEPIQREIISLPNLPINHAKLCSLKSLLKAAQKYKITVSLKADDFDKKQTFELDTAVLTPNNRMLYLLANERLAKIISSGEDTHAMIPKLEQLALFIEKHAPRSTDHEGEKIVKLAEYIRDRVEQLKNPSTDEHKDRLLRSTISHTAYSLGHSVRESFSFCPLPHSTFLVDSTHAGRRKASDATSLHTDKGSLSMLSRTLGAPESRNRSLRTTLRGDCSESNKTKLYQSFKKSGKKTKSNKRFK